MTIADQPATYNHPVRIGGLMRCCTQTLAEHPTPGAEGDKLPCRWCTSSMVFRAGAWEWDHPHLFTAKS